MPPLRDGRSHVARGDSERRDLRAPEPEAARRQHGMQEGEPERALDGRRAQIRLDASEDRAEPDELPFRVQGEQVVDELVTALRRREPLAKPLPDRRAADLLAGPASIRDRRLDRLVLRSALLVSAQLAAVVNLHRLVLDPFELVDRETSPAARALRGEQLVDREPQAGLTERRCGQRRERGVEVAEVRRSEDDLGQEPAQRAQFEGERAALPIDRRPCDPPTSPEQVRDDVAGLAPGFQSGPNEVRRWRRSDPLKCREREPRLRAREQDAPDHRPRLSQVASRVKTLWSDRHPGTTGRLVGDESIDRRADSSVAERVIRGTFDGFGCQTCERDALSSLGVGLIEILSAGRREDAGPPRRGASCCPRTRRLPLRRPLRWCRPAG